ncbi:MAG: ABC transporter ATP-binding protein [Clostridia bacterium]|nr:ABC transporter ATP-binding protein [Clostridia bacterium]
MEEMVQVKGLTKSFGAVHAVQGIDFYVEKGKRFAFLGPNGAGKSTTIDMLSTLLAPDGGEVLIAGLRLGREDGAIRSKIGVVFQDGVLDGRLTVRENLHVRARFYAGDKKSINKAVAEAVQATGMESYVDRQYRKLSGGQRRRADIARALINAPELLFLDEPTTGLDPQTRRNVWETIAAVQRERGMTVFFTTHYMEEAADADFIIIIDDGKIIAKGTPLALKDRYAQDIVRMMPSDPDALVSLLAGEQFVKRGDVFEVASNGRDHALALLNRAEDALADFEVIHGTMDDVFINVTGREVRDV